MKFGFAVMRPRYLLLVPSWMKAFWVNLMVLFCTLTFSISVSLGQDKLRVEVISIIGNTKTKSKVILRELTFQQGDTLSVGSLQEIFDRSSQNIYNLRLFNKVDIQHETLEGRLYVFIEVKERWYIFPIPQLQVEERNTYDLVNAIRNKDFHRLAYGLQLRWRNVTGNNEWLDFYGQFGFSDRLTVNFVRPAIFDQQYTDLLLGLSYVSQKEIIFGTNEGRVQWARLENEPIRKSYGGYIGIRKRFSVFQSLLGYLNYTDIRHNDSIYTFSETFLTQNSGREYYPSLIFIYADDRRDIKSFPLKGYKYQLMFRQSGLPGLGSTRFTKLGFTVAHHLPLSQRWNFAYGTHNIFTIGKRLPFFAKSSVGLGRRDFPGVSNTLRGYEPYGIDGSFVNMTKAELKFALFPRKIIHIKYIPFKKFQDMPLGIYLTAFSDFGYIKDNTFNNQDRFFTDRLLTGYGLGLNVIWIYDTLFRVEYSRNHLGQGGIYLHSSVQIK